MYPLPESYASAYSPRTWGCTEIEAAMVVLRQLFPTHVGVYRKAKVGPFPSERIVPEDAVIEEAKAVLDALKQKKVGPELRETGGL